MDSKQSMNNSSMVISYWGGHFFLYMENCILKYGLSCTGPKQAECLSDPWTVSFSSWQLCPYTPSPSSTHPAHTCPVPGGMSRPQAHWGHKERSLRWTLTFTWFEDAPELIKHHEKRGEKHLSFTVNWVPFRTRKEERKKQFSILSK